MQEGCDDAQNFADPTTIHPSAHPGRRNEQAGL